MLRYLLKQVLTGVVLLVVVTAVTFALVFQDGSGIARRILGQDATAAQVRAKTVQLGLDEPVAEQYVHWVGDALHGSLGTSYFSGQSITSVLATRIPVTLSLIIVSLLLTTVLSVVVGVTAAVRGGWVDRVLQVVGVVGAAVPNFVVAIAAVFCFAIAVHLLPATGYVSLTSDPGQWARSLVLPVVAVLVGSVAGSAQQFRGAVIDVLQQDFVRTLRARGISERAVVYRHVLRNAGAPGLTILSLQTIGLLGGVVVIERVFALPGMGSLASDSAQQGDIPAVMGTVLFTVVVVVVVNILLDLLISWINPRVRLA